jgi:hypothetical protein
MATYTDEEWEEIGSKWREAAGIADILRVDPLGFVRWMKRAGY